MLFIVRYQTAGVVFQSDAECIEDANTLAAMLKAGGFENVTVVAESAQKGGA